MLLVVVVLCFIVSISVVEGDIDVQIAESLEHSCSTDSNGQDSLCLFAPQRDLLKEQECGKGDSMRRWMEAHADGPLMPKPLEAGPDRDSWTNSIGLCSMIQDENSTDIREWILYYKCAFRASSGC